MLFRYKYNRLVNSTNQSIRLIRQFQDQFFVLPGNPIAERVIMRILICRFAEITIPTE
jgi:hypothetical protein